MPPELKSRQEAEPKSGEGDTGPPQQDSPPFSGTPGPNFGEKERAVYTHRPLLADFLFLDAILSPDSPNL
jgi:hypothetical protein